MSPLSRLVMSARFMYAADQIALVAVPIVALLVFDASAGVIGLLVACQSSAHLVGSIPFGLVVDHFQLRTILIASTLLALAGFSAAALALAAGGIAVFGLAVAAAGLGIVLYELATFSVLPKLVDARGLGPANARVSLPRALASFLVPLVLSLLLSAETATATFCIATAGAFAALMVVRTMPTVSRARSPEQPLPGRLATGAKLVLRHGLLRPISLCAIFWNLAFAVLLVVLVPVIVEVYGGHPSLFAGAMAAFGIAAISGIWVAGRIAPSVPPRVILIAGPASSAIASVLLLAVPARPPELVLYPAFFLLGFGPSMWLVVQNTVRQLVTPEDMLGRVNAVIQTAIYGVRPLGALLGGAIAGTWSPEVGLWAVATLFGLSFLAAFLSGLRKVMDYDAMKALPRT